MKNPLTMLVIEDRPNHMQDVHAVLEAELPRIPVQINVLYAEDLEVALQLLPQADIVMTDVFFPASPGEPEQPNGKIVVERCLAEQKPVVWVTSTYHHGRSTNDVSQWGRQHGLEMFDCDVGHGEAPNKPWKKAFYGLLYLMQCIEEGYFTFSGGKMMGPEIEMDKGGLHRSPLGWEIQVSDRLFSEWRFDPEKYPVLQKMLDMGFSPT